VIEPVQQTPREVIVEFDESTERVRSRAVDRPSGYWKLKNGKFIAMSEMGDQHLENCIRLCERNQHARGRRADPLAPGAYGELCSERARRHQRLSEHARYLRMEQGRAIPQQPMIGEIQSAMDQMISEQSRAIPQQSAMNSRLAMTPEQNGTDETIKLPKDAPKRRIRT
jgi:hypothetical protein